MNPFAAATDILAALHRRETSSVATVEMYLERRRRLGPAVNAIVSTADDAAESSARIDRTAPDSTSTSACPSCRRSRWRPTRPRTPLTGRPSGS